MSIITDVSPFSSRKRNSARLDLLTAMMLEGKRGSENNSPHDSLSPLDDDVSMRDFKEEVEEVKRFSFEGWPDEETVSRQTQPPLQEPDLAFPDACAKESRNAVSTAHESTEQKACPPRCCPTLIIRPHRPSDLTFFKTNGATTLPLPELRQCISDAHTHSTNNAATRIQTARPKAEQSPKTPATPSPLLQLQHLHVIMGNKPSSIAGSPAPEDDCSVRSVVRKPLPHLLRKSSTNLLKRIVSQTPLPQDLTATVIQVQQQQQQQQRVSPVSPVSVDGVGEDDNRAENVQSGDVMVAPQSASTMTMTDEYAIQSFSTSTLIQEAQVEPRTAKQNERPRQVGNRDSKPPPEKPAHPRDLALSPTIPAPSPLPEDSPHKYGLKDRTDTPEMPEAEEINVVKARRKSSGLDIFNEAKSLQSASSFLNGLSTSRRRAAESSTPEPSHPNTKPTSRLYPNPRPKKSKPASRQQGHNFKPSNFAYARPLTLPQLKCFRNHSLLLPSRNRKERAPVECAVCHIDDAGEHWSCSWCALRMCGFCRREFDERGLVALRERVRMAELGAGERGSEEEGGILG